MEGSRRNIEHPLAARTMRVVRLTEDYIPDTAPTATTTPTMYKKDLLLQVSPAKDGWVIVKPLESTTSDPSWVPERIVKRALPGFYRARSTIVHRNGVATISAGEIVRVVDTCPYNGSPYNGSPYNGSPYNGSPYNGFQCEQSPYPWVHAQASVKSTCKTMSVEKSYTFY